MSGEKLLILPSPLRSERDRIQRDANEICVAERGQEIVNDVPITARRKALKIDAQHHAFIAPNESCNPIGGIQNVHRATEATRFAFTQIIYGTECPIFGRKFSPFAAFNVTTEPLLVFVNPVR